MAKLLEAKKQLNQRFKCHYRSGKIPLVPISSKPRSSSQSTLALNWNKNIDFFHNFFLPILLMFAVTLGLLLVTSNPNIRAVMLSAVSPSLNPYFNSLPSSSITVLKTHGINPSFTQSPLLFETNSAGSLRLLLATFPLVTQCY